MAGLLSQSSPHRHLPDVGSSVNFYKRQGRCGSNLTKFRFYYCFFYCFSFYCCYTRFAGWSYYTEFNRVSIIVPSIIVIPASRARATTQNLIAFLLLFLLLLFHPLRGLGVTAQNLIAFLLMFVLLLFHPLRGLVLVHRYCSVSITVPPASRARVTAQNLIAFLLLFLLLLLHPLRGLGLLHKI